MDELVPFDKTVKTKTSRRSKNWGTLELNSLKAALRSAETRLQISEDQLKRAREVIQAALGVSDAL
jgi:hypothetical protein